MKTRIHFAVLQHKSIAKAATGARATALADVVPNQVHDVLPNKLV
jgi:hypothetical protein